MPMEHIEILTELKRWVVSQGRVRDESQFKLDSNLMEEGYLDSLGLMSLVAYVEGKIGAEISEKQMSFSSFESLQKIYEVFFHQG